VSYHRCIILAAIRLPLFHRRINALGRYALIGLVGFFALDWMFGISDWVIASMAET